METYRVAGFTRVRQNCAVGLYAVLNQFCGGFNLGGGPASTTLEVAIYQLLRFDFNPPQVVSDGQLLLCLGLAGLVLLFQRLPEVEDAGSWHSLSYSGVANGGTTS